MKAQSRANQKYNAKAYDRIEISVPKGNKAVIMAAAAAESMSVNAYIKKAIEEKMTRS